MKFACKNCNQHFEVEDKYISQVFPVNCKCGINITSENEITVIKDEISNKFHFYHVCYWFCYFSIFTGLVISCVNSWFLLYGIIVAFVWYVLGYFTEHIYLISQRLK